MQQYDQAKGKAPSESTVEMTNLVLPNDTNQLGNLWVDA